MHNLQKDTIVLSRTRFEHFALTLRRYGRIVVKIIVKYIEGVLSVDHALDDRSNIGSFIIILYYQRRVEIKQNIPASNET